MTERLALTRVRSPKRVPGEPLGRCVPDAATRAPTEARGRRLWGQGARVPAPQPHGAGSSGSRRPAEIYAPIFWKNRENTRTPLKN